MEMTKILFYGCYEQEKAILSLRIPSKSLHNVPFQFAKESDGYSSGERPNLRGMRRHCPHLEIQMADHRFFGRNRSQ
jgi:hypothetical protein